MEARDRGSLGGSEEWGQGRECLLPLGRWHRAESWARQKQSGLQSGQVSRAAGTEQAGHKDLEGHENAFFFLKKK